MMDTLRRSYFNRKNQAKMFDILDLMPLVDYIETRIIPPLQLKHTVFEAIFGAIFMVFGMNQAIEFFYKIVKLMGYDELLTNSQKT